MAQRKAWTLDENGNLIEKEIMYPETNENRLNGFGTPISLRLARILILNYKHDHFDPDNPEIAFTFGKESLLSLLSQDNCAGIRFYLAKKKFHSGIEEWEDGITLVAVGVKPEEGSNGVDGDDPEIGAKENYIVDNLEEEVKYEEESGLIIQTIPPFYDPAAKKGIRLMRKLIGEFTDLFK